MPEKTTYEELEQRIREIERETEKRRHAEEALSESENKYRLIFDNAGEGIAVIQDGVPVFINRRMLDMLGFSSKDLARFSDEPFLNFIHPDDRKRVANRYDRRLQRQESPSIYSARLKKKNGEYMWAALSPTFIYWEGRPATLSFLTDISERKAQEEEMQKLASVVKYSRELVNLAALDGRMIFLNSAGSKMLGIDPDEVEQFHIMDVMPDHMTGLVQNELLPALMAGRTWRGELQYRNLKTNQHIDVQAMTFSIQDAITGEPLYLANVSYDITERKQMENALRESEKKYKDLVENIDQVLYANDLDGRFTYISPVCEKMLGYKPEELIGSDANDLIYPEDRDIVNHGYQQVLNGTNSPTDYRVIHKSGRLVWIQSFSKPIYEENEIIAVQGIVRDITEQKKIDQEKKRLESELQQAHKMEAIGTLAGGIAHDFNNILSIIVGNTDMAIQDVPEWNPAAENLKEIQRAGMRARDMIKQILAFSRPTAGQLKPFRLRPIIEESLKMLRSSIPTTIDIVPEITIDTDTINGDPTQINQILINLCTNAQHAMKALGGRLEVSLDNILIDENRIDPYPELRPGNYVRLTVKDTGHGIKPAHVPRIFDPYFTTKEVGEGTGMGLSVIHGIVKNHGGTITVDSKVGRGTTFEVLFPVVDEEQREPAKTASDKITGGNEHILFIDDEPALAQLYKSMLAHLGYTISVRTSSLEALEAFKAQPDKYDLVITDQTMPHMTGQALAREIMSIRPNTPIILCTGHSDLIDDEVARQMGIKAFLMKPLSMAEIAKTIRSVID